MSDATLPARAVVLLSPGDGQAATGGDRYDRALIDGLRAAGRRVERIAVSPRFPWPSAADLDAVAQALDALPHDTLVIADGLAFGAMPALAGATAPRLRWVALVHHPLWLETGLGAAEQALLRESERAALACARAVVVTSETSRADVEALGVPASRLQVCPPGLVLAPTARRERFAVPPRLLCVGSLTPRKGHALLLEALAGLQDRDWTLHLVGSDTRDLPTAAALRAQAEALGLLARVQLHGEVDEATLAAHYAQASLYVSASWHEGYGMAVDEALAQGLPVVTTAAGALGARLPAEAALVVPTGEVLALRAALAAMLDDPARRQSASAAARAAAAALPRWPDVVARWLRVLDAVAA